MPLKIEAHDIPQVLKGLELIHTELANFHSNFQKPSIFDSSLKPGEYEHLVAHLGLLAEQLESLRKTFQQAQHESSLLTTVNHEHVCQMFKVLLSQQVYRLTHAMWLARDRGGAADVLMRDPVADLLNRIDVASQALGVYKSQHVCVWDIFGVQPGEF